MLSLESVVAARLRTGPASLPDGWTVVGASTEKGARSARPLASVLLADAGIADIKAGGVNVQPALRVTLVARKSEDIERVIDEAFAAAIASLHDWPPGKVAGRLWERLSLHQIDAPQNADDGLVGIELVFLTRARYVGHH